MAKRKKRELKKGWKVLLSVCTFLSVFLTYTVFSLFYHIMNMDSIEFDFNEMVSSFLSVGAVFSFIFSDPNLKLIALLLPILILVLLIYLRRDSLFEKQYKDESKFGLHGDSFFEEASDLTDGKVLSEKNKIIPNDVKNTLNSIEEGIIIGRVPESNELLIIHDKTKIDNKNVLVYGASGAGKGQSYVLMNIINIRTQSIVVIDPKGENYALTHQLKRDQGYKVYNVDFVDFAEARYNPLDLVFTDIDAQKVSKNIVDNSTKDGKEDFFSERAQKLLAGLMVYVKSTYPKEKANMNAVIEVYNKHIADPEICDEFMENLPVQHPAYNLLNSVLNGLMGPTRGSVMSSFNSAVAIFQFANIRDMTSASDFSFDEFQDGKSILYVKMSTPTNPYQALTGVFFNQMIDRLYLLAGRNESKKLKMPINIILDEFPNIGRFEGYKEILATCRGLLIYMHTIIQDVSQLEDSSLYGKEGTRGLISNHDTQLVLKVNEIETAEMFAKRFGKTTVSHKAESVSIADGKRSISKNDQFVERDLVTANQILTMDREDAYLLVSGHNVMKIKKAWQYEVFPDLLSDKNRDPNYNKFRKKLGYTNDVFTGNTTRESGILSFEEYQKQNYGSSQNEQSNKEIKEKTESENSVHQVQENASEVATGNVVEGVKEENSAQQEVAVAIETEEKNEEVVKSEVSQETNTTAEVVEEKTAIQIENVSESEINDFRKASQELAAAKQEEENTVDEKLESIEYQTEAIESMFENENIADTVNKLFSDFDQLEEKQNINAEDTQQLESNFVSEKEETEVEHSNEAEDDIDSLFNDIGKSDEVTEENKDQQSKKKYQEAELEDDFLPM